MVIAGLVAGLVTGFGYAAEVSSDDALCAVKGWVLAKTADGLGYDLIRSGFSIIVR